MTDVICRHGESPDECLFCNLYPRDLPVSDELIAEPAEMRNCDLCGAKNVNVSHGCLALNVTMKALRELQAKYERCLAFIRKQSLWDEGNSDPDYADIGARARELLKELEAQ